VAEFTERKIDEARTGYRPIAVQSSLIFFSVIALSPLDPMYQYSLTWFLSLYSDSFDKAASSPYIKQRIQNVSNTLTQIVFM
jgi:dynein heavy chain